MNKTVMPGLKVSQVEDLLATPSDQMLVFNHVNNTLNKGVYSGLVVSTDGLYTFAEVAKMRLERCQELDGRKLVCSAIKGTPEFCWNGPNRFAQYALADEYSPHVMGNIIVFNPKTQQFESNPAGWYGLDVRKLISDGKYRGMYKFWMRLLAFEQERIKFMEPFAKQK